MDNLNFSSDSRQTKCLPQVTMMCPYKENCTANAVCPKDLVLTRDEKDQTRCCCDLSRKFQLNFELSRFND